LPKRRETKEKGPLCIALRVNLDLLFESGGSANSHDPLRVHMLKQALPFSPIQTPNRGDSIKGNQKNRLAQPASDALARLCF